MREVMNILLENNTLTIVTFVVTLASIIFLSLSKKMNENAQMNELELKRAMMENRNTESKNTVQEIIAHIPEGVGEEEFFDRLKKGLLNISYIQLKNDSNINENNSLYKLLEAHHRQALQQSSVQFWFSIFAASIGFLFIIIMICTSVGSAWYEIIVKVLPGTIIDAISVLFFNQAHETRERAANFFKELTYEKQVAKSVAIADAIEDKAIKATVQAKIALYIVGLKDEGIKGNRDRE
ncbi:MAG: hypothetical protein NC341_13770 [Blautia sp.]|nr:hypothetical protein [Blautia sp.]MCM1200060.1 hypothetical protein [Bacteroides fragilis]